MKLRLLTNIGHDGLVQELVGVLGQHGVTVRREEGAPTEFSLAYSSRLSSDEVHGLVRALSPLRPALVPRAAHELGGVDAQLHLGFEGRWADWTLKVHADSAEMARRVAELTGSLAFTQAPSVLQFVDKNRLDYGGAPAPYRQLLLWRLARAGIEVAENHRWGEGDMDLYLYLKDPAHEGKRPAQNFALELHIDDLARGQVLQGRLIAAGFERTRLHYHELGGDRPRFKVHAGPLSHDTAATDLALLKQTIGELLAEAGVEAAYFPLEVETGEGIVGRVELPVGAFEAGRLPPYAGGHPRSFSVQVQTDDLAGVAPLVAALEGLGFARIERLPLGDAACDFALRLGGLSEHAELGRKLRGAVEEFCHQALVESDLEVLAGEPDATVIAITAPLAAHRTGTLRDRILKSAGDFKVKVRTSDAKLREAVLGEIAKLARFAETKGDSDEHAGRPQICFGGAPRPLVRLIASLLPYEPGAVQLDKRWSDEDKDIWVDLPPKGDQAEDAALRAAARDVAVDLEAWLAGGDAGATDPVATRVSPAPVPLDLPAFLEVGEAELRVADVVLSRRGATGSGLAADKDLVPPPELFVHYCLDQRTAETLVHVATSVALGEPCLLEGETSTSKTSSILYLAALLGQPVVRLNLNGQTDTGELVGRYVPSERTTDDLGRAVHPWRWQPGLVVQAMVAGWWVVLDEVNLAEPQILERLNSLLERQPTLVLSEHDNSVYGTAERPVHPDFRLFATMNPAEYTGRTELSPAYRDRWLGYRFTPSPGEGEYLAMLRLLVYGVQPELAIQGARYAGAEQPAPLGELARFSALGSFLPALARFHAALEHASRREGADGQGLGRHRRERYVFTRRSLIGLLEYVSRHAEGEGDLERVLRRGLLRYYIQRVATVEDRRLVTQLLDAAGIGPTTWSFVAKPAVGDQAVVLLGVEEGRKIPVVKAIRAHLRCGLAEAKRLVDSPPARVSGRLGAVAAAEYARELEAAGATLRIDPWA